MKPVSKSGRADKLQHTTNRVNDGVVEGEE
jgi:hypothetical protein